MRMMRMVKMTSLHLPQHLSAPELKVVSLILSSVIIELTAKHLE